MRILQTPEQAADWLRRQGAQHLASDSRRIQHGDAFIAWPGAVTDGRQYVRASLHAGAVAALLELQGAEKFDLNDERIAGYAGLKAACGWIAALFYGQPACDMQVLAVTGTNGKTSTAWWLTQSLNAWHRSPTPSNSLLNKEHSAQEICRLIGTLGLGIPGKMTETGLTTPDPIMLQAALAQWRSEGVRYCAIEASSIGLQEDRLAGTPIHTAIFTNFTQDHLDYHLSMQAYWLAKRALFDWPGLQCAVINLDDPKGSELVAYCQQRGLNIITTSAQTAMADVSASHVQHSAQGMRFVVTEAAEQIEVRCPVVGQYNVANLLGVIGALRSLGLSLEQAGLAVSHCTAVPGRMEVIAHEKAPLVVVDYAHTPDALAKALEALRPLAQARAGQLWCIFGCGGNRDASKRPLMAQAAQAADQIMVTSDNPRDESPEQIAQQIMAGFSSSSVVRMQLQRSLAIEECLQAAQSHDVILLAGKGHEAYQEIGGIKHPYSDIETVHRIFKEMFA